MLEIDKPTSLTSNVEVLFAGKIFRIPDYQRTYAWERTNWEDFWNDIKEGLETQTPHYWGTITLRDTGESQYDKESASVLRIYEVVDGQQRLTTLALFLLALSERGQEVLKDKFVKRGDIYKIELGSLNKSFLADIIDGNMRPPRFKTNRLLKEAFEYFQHQIQAYVGSRQDPDRLTQYVLSATISLEFQVEDESLAIRAFQSLNDRGKDLTLLDKTKSFLMFYSSRYLEGGLNDQINQSFGEIFKNYDLIEEIGRRANIAYITNPRYRFSEDELLRFFYHYFGQYAIEQYSLERLGYDYTITTQNVFKQFLKHSCNLLKAENGQLHRFIAEFLSDFTKFVRDFRELLKNAERNSPYRNMFSFLGLSAAIYPLIISAESEGIVEHGLLEAIETLDLRVYKVRGTNPRADLYRNTISTIKVDPDPDRIRRDIKGFIGDFMRDTEFQTYLYRNMHKNAATKYILWEFEKTQSSDFDEWNYALYSDLQVEHIFPGEPTFAFPGYQFQDGADYLDNIHRLGNLTLLEEAINKRVGNRVPPDKAPDYQKSTVPGTRKLGFGIENAGFGKQDIDGRTERTVDFCLGRWEL